MYVNAIQEPSKSMKFVTLVVGKMLTSTSRTNVSVDLTINSISNIDVFKSVIVAPIQLTLETEDVIANQDTSEIPT